MTKIAKTVKASSKVSAKAPKAPAKAPAKKAPAKAPLLKAGDLGEREGSLKGKFLALLFSGKPVKVGDAKEALYGKGNPAPIAGVLLGARIAVEKAGRTWVKEGKGDDALISFR